MKKKPAPLHDLDIMPFGPHRGEMMSKVPALHLLSLIGSEDLSKHPEVLGYIERAKRMLLREAQDQQEESEHD